MAWDREICTLLMLRRSMSHCTLYLKTINKQYVSESHGMHTTLSTPVITGWRHFIVRSWQWMRDPWDITLGIVRSFRPVVTLPYRRTLIDGCNNSWRWHWFFIEHIVKGILDWVEHWICAWSNGTCSGRRLHLERNTHRNFFSCCKVKNSEP